MSIVTTFRRLEPQFYLVLQMISINPMFFFLFSCTIALMIITSTLIKLLKLLFLVMSADNNASSLCHGSQNGASFFVLKPISTKDLKSIWDFGNQWKKKLAKGKIKVSDYGYDNDNKDDIGNKLYEKNPKRKLKIIDDGDHDDSENTAMKGKSLATKKNKVVWTPYLHGKFVQALQHLGPEGKMLLHFINFIHYSLMVEIMHHIF